MLGRAIGRSGAQVSKYELGLDLLDAERTHQCAQALGCGFLDIFLGGRLELAEEAAPFVHEHAPQHGPELHGLLATARASLSPERQIILRDVVLELLKAQEAPPSVAPA
jgi:transcriptional regulator with XRE-family HTH domain